MVDGFINFNLNEKTPTIIKVIGVGGGGGNGIVVAQKRRLGRAAHAGRHDGIRRAVDRVGETVYQKIPQIVENTQLFKVVDRDLNVVYVGKILPEAAGNQQVGRDVEEDRHAEIQHIVREPQRDGNFRQTRRHVAAKVNLGAVVALLGAGVHQAPGYQKVAAQRRNHVQSVHGVGRGGGHIGHDPPQHSRADECQPRNDHADDAVRPFVHRHILADLFLIFRGDLLIQPVADNAADAELCDREKVEQLADDLGRGGDLRAEVIDQQPPCDQPQQQQQQAGAKGVSHI